MSNSNIEDTQPDPVPTVPSLIKSSKKPSRLYWILGGILLILILTGAGSYAGYIQAVGQRLALQQTQVAQNLDEQFKLALKDYYTGKMENARTRLEAIINSNPSYPGAVDLLTKVSLVINTKDTPTPAPTMTLTPTQDSRGVQDLLQQAKTSIAAKDWATAMAALDNLRKADRTYKTVEVDDLYYVILRNQGIALITQGSLEMGLYDLSLAERFGYLDAQAEGLRSVSRLYLTGASFWEVDWQQAASYFEQVYPLYPSLHDASGMSAEERWRKSILGYADQLNAAGSVCKAEKLYQQIVDLGKNPEVKPTLEAAKQDCEGKNTPTPTEGPTVTATATAVAGETATPTPTQGAGVTNTPVPTTPPAATNTPEPTKPPEAKPSTDTPVPATDTPKPPATDTPKPTDTPKAM
jgi:hypothetical protein